MVHNYCVSAKNFFVDIQLGGLFVILSVSYDDYGTDENYGWGFK